MTLSRFVGTVDSIAVQLPWPELREIGVPYLRGFLPQRNSSDLVFAVGRVKKAKLYAFGIFGEERKIDARSVPRCPERVGFSRPDFHDVAMASLLQKVGARSNWRGQKERNSGHSWIASNAPRGLFHGGIEYDQLLILPLLSPVAPSRVVPQGCNPTLFFAQVSQGRQLLTQTKELLIQLKGVSPCCRVCSLRQAAAAVNDRSSPNWFFVLPGPAPRCHCRRRNSGRGLSRGRSRFRFPAG